MTCKDCINYSVCLGRGNIFTQDYLELADEDCDFFKDKDKYVESVRCKDCKYHYKVPDQKNLHLCMVRSLIFQTTYDGFCSKGERKV